MILNPPPQTIPETYKPGFIQEVIDSITALFDNESKLIEFSESLLIQTTTATVTSLDLIPVQDENTFHVNSIILAVLSGGTARASYEIAGTFYRTGGTLTQQGTTTVVHSQESVAGWDATYDVNGNDIRIRVTGAAASNIDWRSSSKIMKLSN